MRVTGYAVYAEILNELMNWVCLIAKSWRGGLKDRDTITEWWKGRTPFQRIGSN